MNLVFKRNRIHLLGHFFPIHVLTRYPAGKQGYIGLVPFDTGHRRNDLNTRLFFGAVAPGAVNGPGCFLLSHQCLVTIDTGIVRCRANRRGFGCFLFLVAIATTALFTFGIDRFLGRFIVGVMTGAAVDGFCRVCRLNSVC